MPEGVCHWKKIAYAIKKRGRVEAGLVDTSCLLKLGPPPVDAARKAGWNLAHNGRKCGDKPDLTVWPGGEVDEAG